jgi:hypothetical protein
MNFSALLCLVVGFLAVVPVHANVSIYTTLAGETQVPDRSAREHFSCTDQVYAVIELDDYSDGEHQLSVKWISPAGEQRELTRYGFSVFNKEERIWAWIKLHRASGAGMMQWLDPSAGMEEFIGNWKISIAIDDVLVGESSFEVLC